MTIVDQVALWAGLISSIVSIVLSIVAIVFAILVDRNSRLVTAQTIKSLQKIETEVERLSSDTRQLIKAGWDKMLGSSYPPATQPDPTNAKELAAGIASELRAELNLHTEKPHSAEQASLEAKINDALRDLESTLTAQMRTEPVATRSGGAVARAEELLHSISPLARALASHLSASHLTRAQYVDLSKGPLSEAISELRNAGLLVPLRAAGPDKEYPVYYFPPQLAKPLRALISMMPIPSDEIRDLITVELKKIKYPDAPDGT